jgi:hypothetical protein
MVLECMEAGQELIRFERLLKTFLKPFRFLSLSVNFFSQIVRPLLEDRLSIQWLIVIFLYVFENIIALIERKSRNARIC